MSPGLVPEVVEGITKRIRSPLLVFVLVLNFIMLGFIYFGVADRRAKDHEILKQCIEDLQRKG